MDIIRLSEFTKTNISKIAEQAIQRVKDGEENPLELYIQLKALEEATKAIKDAIKDAAKNEASKYGKGEYLKGAGLSMRSYKLLDYSKDPVIAKLEALIKERQEVVKAAVAQAEKGLTLVDENGEVVNPVPYKVNTENLVISFKK